MTNNLRGYAVDVRSAPGSPIPFVASTQNLARDGMIIRASAWDVNAYMRNPVVLFAHRYDSLPIGRAENIRRTDDALLCDIRLDVENDPLAAQIDAKIRAGYLNACSVGFEVKDYEPNSNPRIVTRAELLDVSVVAVPSDAGALAQARSVYQRSFQSAPQGEKATPQGILDTLKRMQHRQAEEELTGLIKRYVKEELLR